MTVRSDLLKAIDALPTHCIGGWEWECYNCHDHWADTPCARTGQVTAEGDYDNDEQPCNHGMLLDYNRVREAIKAVLA